MFTRIEKMTGNYGRVLYNHFRKVISLKLLLALRPEVYEAALNTMKRIFPITTIDLNMYMLRRSLLPTQNVR